MTEFQGTAEKLDWLLSTKAVREQSQKIFEMCKKGETHFSFDEDKLQEVAEFVIKITGENYPDMNIPFHSRWKHFQVGEVDRLAQLYKMIAHESDIEKTRIKFDLVIVSVLLDAGAGPHWKYFEKESGKSFSRSEGLAVASFHMFMEGKFSSDPSKPLRCDSAALQKLKVTELKEGFQISDENPFVGCEGRVQLLQSLGEVIGQSSYFKGDVVRPGNIVDFFKAQNKVSGHLLVQTMLKALGKVWPSDLRFNQEALGDVWSYPPLGEGVNGLVPFHKLTQWLSYSLIEPLEELGIKVQDLDSLTGLPEYRNGGLFLDAGVIQLRDAADAFVKHEVGSELIVEWRALTICLLDLVGQRIQKILGQTSKELPLMKILEGGTWWAGRRLAAQKREGATPPLQFESSGNVF